VAGATDFRDQPDAAAGRESLRPDLKQRLADLPPGHPSSLRHDVPDGASRDLDDAGHGADRLNRDLEGPDHRPDAAERDYWSEVPRFQRARAAHLRRWPEGRRAPVDRSRDPVGSWRGDGNQYLSPEQHAEANTVIANVRRCEETISGHMQDIERESGSGSLHGWQFRRKEDDRLKEKIAEKVEHQPDRTVGEALREINDAIRYTFCLDSSGYVVGYEDIKYQLQDRGYRMVYSKNHWRDDPEYKGINSRWLTSDGQRFEVQFHTLESFHAKQEITHRSYERIRNRLTVRSERLELESFQREVCRWIAVPGEAESIPDYMEED
jgi:hypothetical protein